MVRAAGTYYLSCPEGTTDGVTMKFEKDGKTYTKSSANTLTLENGKIRNMGEIKFADLILVTNLSAYGTANSYIVSAAGQYKFQTVKGNSSDSVGEVASVEVLWESFGTATAPAIGDLVKNVSFADDYISFEATSKKGNALIAAKDASGTILWSWHIWMTDKPEDQVYYNNAGTMMDRNLGATSATKGDVGALGLMYQWGRKDPFLGSSSINSAIQAESTGTWPSAVTSDSSTGTIAYAQEHPMTFIAYNENNHDWYYAEDASTDDTRWQSEKTIYDPCPVGYRVPDGGNKAAGGIWSRALNSGQTFRHSWDNTNMGMDFNYKFGYSYYSPIWYPGAGRLAEDSGQLTGIGGNINENFGCYWSVTPEYGLAYYLYFTDWDSYVDPKYSMYRSAGQSVRCCMESLQL